MPAFRASSSMARPISAMRCSIEHMIESYRSVPTVRRLIAPIPASVLVANPMYQNGCTAIVSARAWDAVGHF